MKSQRTYIAIDLKSFYASVECVERGLDPMTTNLVVADESRTDKTICLAVTPSLKAFGIGGRPRLFEVARRVKEVNAERRLRNTQPIDYLVAMPRMALYIKYSTRIHNIYMKYVSPEDIHVYSIDEVFMDVTNYLALYKTTAHNLTREIICEVLAQTGITATAGIGTNLYLAKVAMDIVAKHIPADKDGVRIAELDEMSYRYQLWDHRPLTDFWRVGRGIANRLSKYGIDTMGKIARCSLVSEELLYREFGVNAELLIDHAWGWEPCTIAAIKAYKPETNTLSHGQVLTQPYETKKARVVIEEMANGIALDLTEKQLVADQISIDIGYDSKNLTTPSISQAYSGKIHNDRYGRKVPDHTNGTSRLSHHTDSSTEITHTVLHLFDRVANPLLLIRRLTITVGNVISRDTYIQSDKVTQLNLFAEENVLPQQNKKEGTLQQTMLRIKKRFGKNALLQGISFNEGATARQRNIQIGGHKA